MFIYVFSMLAPVREVPAYTANQWTIFFKIS